MNGNGIYIETKFNMTPEIKNKIFQFFIYISQISDDRKLLNRKSI